MQFGMPTLMENSARLSAAKKNNCRCVIETKTIAALKESVAWLKRERW